MTTEGHEQTDENSTDSESIETEYDDYRVELKDRPVLVRPDIEVDLDIVLRNVDISLIRDGLIDTRSEQPFRPIDAVHERIRDKIENEGYQLERYASFGFAIPTAGSYLTSAEFTLKVTGREEDDE